MTTLAPTTMLTTLAPTTLAPTTLAPTTVAPTTLAPTSLAPTTYVSGTDHANDITFNCYNNDYAGVPQIETYIEGVLLHKVFTASYSDLLVETYISGQCAESVVFDMSSDLGLFVDTYIEGTSTANENKANWVGWSKIGEANFILDRVNDAGFKPMVWPGYVYQILKLGKNAIVYGSGGVTMMVPVGEPFPTFSFKELYDVGIKNKTAVTGNESVHYFIDRSGCLFKLADGIEKLGYEEFLSPMVNPLLFYDSVKDRLYISDDDNGYVYNESALTGGYSGLTGLYRLNNILYAVSHSEVEVLPVSIITDVFDFNYRGMKSIESIQFDVDCIDTLYAAVDYRFRKDTSFKTTRWTALNSSGIAHIRTAGVEFRVRLKTLVRSNFELSYMLFQYKYIDRRFARGPIGDTGEPQ